VTVPSGRIKANRGLRKEIIVGVLDHIVDNTFGQVNLLSDIGPRGLNSFENPVSGDSRGPTQYIIVGCLPVVSGPNIVPDPSTVQPAISGLGFGASFFPGELTAGTLATRGMSLPTVAAIGILAPLAARPATFGGTDNYG
jgi:hypothetical protein